MPIANKRQRTKRMADTPAVDRIVELVQSMQFVFRQSYELQRPIVADMCANAASVSECDLERVFDRVLDISCTDEGRALFNKLCQTFKEQYPECVKDYIRIQAETHGGGFVDEDEA